jgi:hypothetical protein
MHAEKESQALFGFFVGPTQLPRLTPGRSDAASLVTVAAEIIVIETAIVASAKAYTVLPRLILWRMTTTSIISSSIRCPFSQDALSPPFPRTNTPEPGAT